jgi:type III restriction enzyme
MTMKLQFSLQAHQAKAVAAVNKVFNGLPLAWSDFSLTGQNASVVHAADGTFRWRGIR